MKQVMLVLPGLYVLKSCLCDRFHHAEDFFFRAIHRPYLTSPPTLRGFVSTYFTLFPSIYFLASLRAFHGGLDIEAKV